MKRRNFAGPLRAFLTCVALVALGNALEAALPGSWARPQLDLAALLFFAFRFRASDGWGLACALALLDTLLEPRLLGLLLLFYLFVVHLAGTVSRTDLRDNLVARVLLALGLDALWELGLSGRLSVWNGALTWLIWQAAERRVRRPPASGRRRWGWS